MTDTARHPTEPPRPLPDWYTRKPRGIIAPAIGFVVVAIPVGLAIGGELYDWAVDRWHGIDNLRRVGGLS